jgi:serine/threonine-protein kinase
MIVGVAVLVVLLGITAAFILRALGTSEVVVPDVSGMDADDAGARLEATGLDVGFVATETATGLAPGVVVTQTPAPDSTVRSGTDVDLVVSVQPDWVKAPDLVGMPILDAEAVLLEEGLEPLRYEGYDQQFPTGFVAGQLPDYNVPVAAGDPVLLYVSVGYRTGGVVVPVLSKTSPEDAARSAEQAGLTPQIVHVRSQGGAPGTLLGQIPKAGVRVPEGSPVGIVVAADPGEE